jgi:hypothetical protein
VKEQTGLSLILKDTATAIDGQETFQNGKRAYIGVLLPLEAERPFDPGLGNPAGFHQKTSK